MSTLDSSGRKFVCPSTSNAATPLTTALAMLVPDNCMYASAPVPPTCRWEYVLARYDSLASAPTTRTPGATTSGFKIRSNRVGPFELNAASVSSLRCGVCFVSTAPTVNAYGLFPGDVISPYW